METIEQQFKNTPTTQLDKVRVEAFNAFEKLGIPTSRVEAWKYTNIKTKLSKDFILTPIESEVNTAVKNYIASLPPYAFRLVFLNGIFHQELSIIPEIEGLYITNLKEAFANKSSNIEQYFGKAVNYNEEHFAALNTAFVTDGAFIHVSKNVAIEEPIYLHYFFTATDADAFVQTRNLVVVEDGASLQIAEDFRNASNITVQYNHVTESFIGKNAQLTLVKLQVETKNVKGIHSLEALLQRDSTFNASTITFEGNVIRNNITAQLLGENAHADLSGLYFGKENASIDNNILVKHLAPNCTSNQLYKGVMNDESVGSFSGKIFVDQIAQKTNAFQSSKGLLLSNEASINNRPNLEIFADDVKCSHGAAIGQLDENALFYLQARGIPFELAKHRLTYAFVHEVAERIQAKPLRQFICDKLKEELKLNW
ncbi:MAG TPA: Fe-S cluster assembly protein SufD [Chitinophagales bacterium]|nr:Fe-S cluster assembly protein SufD [Chitinophagales bacterium]